MNRCDDTGNPGQETIRCWRGKEFVKIGNRMRIISGAVLVLISSFIFMFFGNKNKVSAMGDAKSVMDEDAFTRQRKRMVEEQIACRGVKDTRVLEAMEFVPRHLFIPEETRFSSYYDQPVPVGFGQTISQPYIVAFMTELLQTQAGSVVLEVGTGSGYQAAVLARLVKQVYTIELVEELGKEARNRLKTLGYNNVEVMIGDGYKGWPEHAPFDAIIVTAAAEHIPQPLIDQLKPGGRMVIPVGGVYAVQDLMLITKDASSKVVKESVIPVRFVPLLRK
ncbi:MAG: protein-L-isoaspartate O-methyltransferase [Candidatus Brocadia fulgida]|uniref:Protein-L-isoaspartate O-methyltransferase n=1 Tax=Candidatus Brocadia fulgida TaxID=380242 RepID=A0A0M2V015_9BACT|nr:MAG: protein-L-isoaspartate O-methyltransferase [Candidatus Brocadia fulgida]